ncbi:hypothetical protein J31TS4_07810 [Paenibacillus sp. J31TS4]|uniref:hypothetical protein n=1 Tax=Paenibacillus sp. J31TS4 TaxID=2807195 RepID=UPI001B1FE21E|nr:hypothetical protein [Paenibacillus sp. J31TS4]GIP37501.1 hypothetical protein J31TS4_07810 [Paenibacillus sp. J31TS4]
MRLGTFLLGGLAGAAAVVYLNRRGSMLAGLANSEGTAGQFLNKAKQAVSSFQMGAMSSSSGKSGHQSRSEANGSKHENARQAAGRQGGSMEQVEHLIDEDPQLKATVQDILQHNHKSDFSPIHK